jgi:hypothetical protein
VHGGRSNQITDIDAFRRLELENDFIIRLRELSRAAEDLDREHRRLCNQLRELLYRYFPAVLQLSSGADEAWAWDMLAISPLPSKALRMRLGRIEKILKAIHIRRLTAAQVCDVLRSEAFNVARGSAESTAEHVCVLLPLARPAREAKIGQSLANNRR